MPAKVPLPVVLTGAAIVGSAIIIRLYPEHLPSKPLLPVSLSLFAIELVATLVYYVFINPFFVTPLRHLPQPTKGGNFILGHGYVNLEKPRGVTFLNWLQEIPNEGVIYFRSYFNSARVLVTNHEALKEILVTKSYEFEKPLGLRSTLREMLGDGLIIVEGEDHAFLRKNLMPAFSFRHIKDLYPIFWDKSVELIHALGQEVAAAPGKSIELNHWANQVTMDIIGLSAMARDFQCLKATGRHPLVANYEEMLEPTMAKQLYFIASVLGPTELLKKLPISLNKQIERIMGQLTDLCLEMVRDKRKVVADEKAGSDESTVKRDILGLLVRSGNFTDRQLVDQMLTFLAAGHETTSSTLTWTAYLLAKNPDIQTALRQELYAHLPSPKTTPPPSFDLSATLESLPLLNGVCNEASRLYPTVPVTTRVATKTTTLAGKTIPEGTQVLMAPWATNRDPALWGPNADQFDPGRWIDEDPKTGRPRPNNSGGAASNYAFLTFLHGPRSCIGQNFARAELRCLVAAFVARFDLKLARPHEQVLPAGVVTLKPEGGMHLILKDLGEWEGNVGEKV